MFRIRYTVILLFIIGITFDNINCDSGVSKEEGNIFLSEIKLKIGEENVIGNSSFEARIRTKRRIKYERIRTPSGRSVTITSPMFTTATCGTRATFINLNRHGAMVKHDYNLVMGEFSSMWPDSYKCFGKVKIRKIINGCLWNNYKMRREDIRLELNRTDVNEQLLFFGTRRVSPYTSTGFDERRSTGGPFGSGIYFKRFSSEADNDAANSRCHTNSYDLQSCTRTMLLSRVILGEEYRTNAQVKQAHAPIGHHSVVGTIGNRDYFAVYRGEQIYPEYEISYKLKPCSRRPSPRRIPRPSPRPSPSPRKPQNIFERIFGWW